MLSRPAGEKFYDSAFEGKKGRRRGTSLHPACLVWAMQAGGVCGGRFGGELRLEHHFPGLWFQPDAVITQQRGQQLDVVGRATVQPATAGVGLGVGVVLWVVLWDRHYVAGGGVASGHGDEVRGDEGQVREALGSGCDAQGAPDVGFHVGFQSGGGQA